MKYIIDDEELKEFVKNPLAYKFVDDFLKSKTPVEEIAEGKIEKNNWNQFVFVNNDEEILGYINTYPNILAKEQEELLNNSTGKKVRIYIGVIK